MRLFGLLPILLAALALPAQAAGLHITLRVRDTTCSRAAFVARYAEPLAGALAAQGAGRVTVPCAVPRDPDTGSAGETRDLRLVLNDPDRALPRLMAYLKAHPLPEGSGMAYLERGRIVILLFTDPHPASAARSGVDPAARGKRPLVPTGQE